MSDWFLDDSSPRSGTAGVIYQWSGGTLIGTAVANVKTATWALLNPAIPFDADLAIVQIGPRTRGVNSVQQFFDVAKGTAGSESIFLTNLAHATSASQQCAVFYFPISIPAGTRLTAREQASQTGDTGSISLTLLSSGMSTPSPFSRITTYGATTSTTRGVLVDGGATANKKGAWAEIVASTTSSTKAIILVMTNGGLSRGQAHYLVDVGIGPAGSETVFLPNLPFRVNATLNVTPQTSGPWEVNVPAGNRLAVRMQTNTTNATDRTLDCLLYAMG